MQSWGKDPGETLGPGRYRRRAAREASSYCGGRCQAPLGFGGRGMVPAGPTRTPGPSR